MRSSSSVLLALSLAINVTLLGAWWRSRVDPEETAKRAHASSPSAPVMTVSGKVDVSGLSPELILKLKAGDPEALRDLLDACGASRQLTRWVIQSLVDYRFQDEKIAATMRARGTGWWKEEPSWWRLPEREEITRREKAEVERLVAGYPKKEDTYAWRTEKLDFLGTERREAVLRLLKDYEEMRGKLPPTPWLPHEAEMHRKLVEEERRDLVALLSPEELAEYDFREDAEFLGRDLDKYNVTDAELRAVYRAREEMAARLRQLEAKYPGYKQDPFAPAYDHDPQAMTEASLLQKAYDQRVLEIFGDERMARGERESDPVFERIQEVTTKFSLEKRQAEKIYDLLKRARDEASELALERNEQGAARVAALRQDTLEQLNEVLPPGGAGLLLDQVATFYYWLKE